MPDPDQEIKNTYNCCLECGKDFNESKGVHPRLVEKNPDL
jgi:hypothetical protein